MKLPRISVKFASFRKFGPQDTIINTIIKSNHHNHFLGKVEICITIIATHSNPLKETIPPNRRVGPTNRYLCQSPSALLTELIHPEYQRLEFHLTPVFSAVKGIRNTLNIKRLFA